jgi:hypothetical protein
MIRPSKGSPLWSTSSLDGAPSQSPAELAALATQLDHCNDSRGRFFRIRSAVDNADGLARGRFITTLLVVAVAVVATWLVF